MTPADLSRTVLRAVRRAVEDEKLSVVVPARIVVERPRPGGRGDFASNVALQLAGPAGRPPREVAELLSTALADEPGIADIEITGPGFLNFTLGDTSGSQVVRDVLALREAYGRADLLAGRELGFAPVDELRAGIVTDTVVRLLRTLGARAGVVPGGDQTLRVAPVPRGAGDVFERYGADAARWAMLSGPAQETPRFTDALLAQTEDNPLFRVRYAHARVRALLRNAAELGFASEPGEADGPLLAFLADHPSVLEAAAHHRAPDRLARHLVGGADAVLAHQHAVLPLGDEKPSAAHRARLALAEAAGTVLAGGLTLLGISAPEHL
ncbi:DALR anticodon-binding domain-containing protein [Streptomyces sp. LHD-70]|uniref:ArgS-related anticodon-binding protein NrtL n=1 Tax=Streptomyces sp. LHD-70 TaxID=3072140 RepID=UPI00280F7881|nr:DALR anticodon-binding domain-containing protein [Streptomyces sp. LHD-70]MDQ8702107.1 DALR anticodon-binding domain-containing protein [Streptomyces sp. LHD-70]